MERAHLRAPHCLPRLIPSRALMSVAPIAKRHIVHLLLPMFLVGAPPIYRLDAIFIRAARHPYTNAPILLVTVVKTRRQIQRQHN